MRITHICLVEGYTEGLNYQENMIIKYQAKEGHRVSLITTDHCFTEGVWGVCETESDYLNPQGVRIIRLPFLFPVPYALNRKIGIFKNTVKVLEELRPDVIFVHNLQFWDVKEIVQYKKKHPEVTLYADNHSDFSNSARNWIARNVLYRFWWKPCAKKMEPWTEKFFGVLPARIDFLENVYGIAHEKTDLLVMGADDECVQKAAQPKVKKRIREQFHIDEKDFLIVTGGKIDAFKTQTLFLMEAVQRIKSDKVKLLVFGSVEENLKEPLLKLSDGSKVQYIGWAKGNQSYEYFGAADLVVFPGRHSVYWEQVVAQGIPMVCKYWEGTTHVDIGGNVEFLYKDSIEEIQEKLEEIIRHPEKYNEMKKKAKGTGKEEFSYVKIARKSIGL